MSIIGGGRWRRYRRPEPTHPEWCVQGHQCDYHTNVSGGGRHIGGPATIRTPYGHVVGHRKMYRGRGETFSLALEVALSGNPASAAAEAAVLVPNVDGAVRLSLATLNPMLAVSAP